MFVNHIYDNIQKQTLILPQGAVGTLLGTDPITSQNANGAVFVAAATTPVLVRANFDNARSWGFEHQGRCRSAKGLTVDGSSRISTSRTRRPTWRRTSRAACPRRMRGSAFATRTPRSRWWVQPYLRMPAEQSNLSTLDLGDRRTGAAHPHQHPQVLPQRRDAIAAGSAQARTARSASADDLLTATGETIAQIQDRVLGAANNAPLFAPVEGLRAGGVRAGYRLGRHEILVRSREPERRELPRHQLGHRCARPRPLGALSTELLIQNQLTVDGRTSHSA